MRTVNVGAKNFLNGDDIKTKKDLKARMKLAPDSVLFYTTSIFDEGMTWKGDALEERLCLSVCGPNPYESRIWFANVYPNGNVE
jgi:hypothetical protein